MNKKIFRNFCLIALVSVLLTALLLLTAVYRQFYDHMRRQVQDEGSFIALILDGGYAAGGGARGDGGAGGGGAGGVPIDAGGASPAGLDTAAAFLRRAGAVSPSSRLTLIAADGRVLFDNQAAAATMENHLEREEVRQALRHGYGQAQRLSDTLGGQTFYYARKLADGTVLRVAATANTAWLALTAILPWLFLMLAPVLALAVLLARHQTKTIIRPINQIDLEAPLSQPVYDELAPLLLRMDEQQKQLRRQIGALRKQQEEFAGITENMREGLMVLGREGQVLTVNQSAARLFSLPPSRIKNRHILRICREPALQQAVEAAWAGGPGEGLLTLEERVYQLLANPVPGENGTEGIVLLLFDHTERYQAEKLRREFTANVSHELKTPLTAIRGYGELIINGMVRAEDIGVFAGRIYDEANRLLAMIEDILRLSRLEEKGGGEGLENAALLDCAKRAARRLEAAAAEKKVELLVTGEECAVFGDPGLLEEMVFNLCDNAIKYNRPGGRAEAVLERQESEAVLTVTDNGVGIGREHQARIFERFYRADQSRSKGIAGTGLGLSIVKHIVQRHQGKIRLESEAGSGTRIEIRLPLG
ncbi:MAG: PAS domain-containing protein [Peptococcaceae bacterium]|nr:PAS domain-containing protein [Peptococcaceae bacterium]